MLRYLGFENSMLQTLFRYGFSKMDMFEVQHINKLYGKRWFEKYSAVFQDELSELSLEEQIKKVKIDAIPPNTFFFREPLFFDMLSAFIKEKDKIAFVGCSSGEEVYSLYLKESERNLNFTLHGYDFAEERIKTANKGMYEINKEALEFISNQGDEDAVTLMSIGEKSYVTFKQGPKFFTWDIEQNALSEKYDIIACNNVLCHYSQFGRERILQNIAKSLNPGGLLACEIVVNKGPAGKKEYNKHMADLSKSGFEKQQVVIYSSELGAVVDATKDTKLYKLKAN